MVKGYFDLLAHLVERKTDNFDVIGSIPILIVLVSLLTKGNSTL